MSPIFSRLFCKTISIHQSIPVLARNWHKEAINVTWQKPKVGWTKLNFDGSCKFKTGKCSIGGIFRNHNAEFLLGYTESIGPISNSTIAELTALVRGLELVLENGWTHIWLEGDSKSLVDIISQRREAKCAQVQKHVAHVNLIIPEIRNCIVTHTYREGNRAADKFARMGHRLKKPQIWRHVPPNEVKRIVDEDAQGKIFVRRRIPPIHQSIPVLSRKLHKEAINVTWQKPKIGWTKLNYDGSCKSKTGKSSIGCIFRNHNAEFLLGYAESIGQTSNSTIVELAALVRGLELVLENGWTHLWLEGDSKSLVDIISQGRNAKCVQVRKYVARVNLIIPEIRNCIVTHTYREGNRAADKFARMGHGLEKPQIWKDVPPNEVARFVDEDALSKIVVRRI